jgi:hypothetical protein
LAYPNPRFFSIKTTTPPNEIQVFSLFFQNIIKNGEPSTRDMAQYIFTLFLEGKNGVYVCLPLLVEVL